MISLLNADALRIPLADGVVQCCVTSPPYWGLRDYGVGGQLGLEPTPEEYVANMVQVFREVWRVMRDDGVLWLNLGDSYAQGGNGPGSEHYRADCIGLATGTARALSPKKAPAGLKPKDLVGIPWRVAFALQTDGWYLRSDIIWAKPNPMPESVTDRPTKSHEYVFLLTKQERYFYDADSVREAYITPLEKIPDQYRTGNRYIHSKGDNHTCGEESPRGGSANPAGRNRRTVWTIATAPYSGAHFATYPPALVEPCIKAGTPEAGSCSNCGAPWKRVVDRVGTYQERKEAAGYPVGGDIQRGHNGTHAPGVSHDLYSQTVTKGFTPTCSCNAPTRPAIVFDPFAGSGTTLLVARQLGRSAVGTDLSLAYLRDQAKTRLGMTALEQWTGGKQAGNDGYHDLPLFGEAGR